MDLNRLKKELRNFEGIKRKKGLSQTADFFSDQESARGFGEDAAIIERDEEAILFSADGIREDLLKADPELSGYYFVLVNVLDILAMGGSPLGIVDIIASSSGDEKEKMMRGMKKASEKFQVPILGGHILPKSSYTSLNGAILGSVSKDSIVYSNTAMVGDDIVIGIDLKGKIPETCSLCWDSTRGRSKDILEKQMNVMRELSRNNLITAGKDISNPGIIGTLGMLIEYSKCGGVVNMGGIPKPEGISFEKWLKAYPGMGFVITCDPGNTKEVKSTISEGNLTAGEIGSINESDKLEMKSGEDKVTLFDFKADEITGFGINGKSD